MSPKVVAQHQGKNYPIFREVFWNSAWEGGGAVFLSESVLGKQEDCSFYLPVSANRIAEEGEGAVRFAQLV